MERLCWNIRNCLSVHVWMDPWIPLTPYFFKVNPPDLLAYDIHQCFKGVDPVCAQCVVQYLKHKSKQLQIDMVSGVEW